MHVWFLDYAGLSKRIEWSNPEMRYRRKALYYLLLLRIIYFLLIT